MCTVNSPVFNGENYMSKTTIRIVCLALAGIMVISLLVPTILTVIG